MEMNEFGDFFGQMPPVLIFNVCMVMFLIGGLLVYFTLVRPYVKMRNRKGQETASPAFNTPVPYIPPRRNGEYTVKLPDGQSARAIEVLAILRDTADDRLIVQLDSTGYRTLVDHPEVKSKFTALMKELAETIARADTPRPVLETAQNISLSADLEMPDDLDLPDLDSLSSVPTPLPAPVTPPKRPTPPPASGTMPGTLPNYREASEPKVTKQGLFRAPKVEFQTMPELNLAASIEAYLQHRLSHTPEYAHRDIHVHAAPGGGVRIQVDDRYYDAVGDVEDPSIRSFITFAIEEWQEQQ